MILRGQKIVNSIKKKPKSYIFIFVVVFAFIVQAFIIFDMSKIEIASPSDITKKGDIYLNDWNKDNSIFSLDGEWEKIEEIVTPSNFSTKNFGYENIPGSWSPGFFPKNYKGVSTYRIRVHLPDHLIGDYLGIRTSNIRQDYRIYIDNRLMFENGSFSNNGTYYPSGIPRTTFFKLQYSTIEIVVQVKNDLLHSPGIGHSVLIGKEEVIRKFSMTKNNMDTILITTILSISIYLLLYFFIFYVNNYVNFNYLILSMNALMFAISAGGYREKLLFQFLYNLDTAVLIWIHDFSKVGYYLTLLFLFYNARKNDYPRLIFKLLLIYVLILLCVLVLVPISIYGAYYDFLYTCK